MRTFFLFISFLSALHIHAQENFKALTYNLSDGLGKNVDQLQDWMKEQDVDVVAFQGWEGSEEELKKVAKKWKHKYMATAAKGLVLTAKSPIKLTSSEEYLSAIVEGMHIYVAQINQDSFSYRTAMATTIAADMEQQISSGAKVVFMGNVEGYAKADSAIYAQRFRIVPVEERVNRDVIMQVASYSRSKNYDLLRILTAKDMIDPIGEMRKGDRVQPTFPSKKMGKIPEYSTFRVDYILLSANLKSSIKNAAILNDAFTHTFSSHYPVLIELEK